MIAMIGDVHGELGFYKIEKMLDLLEEGDYCLIWGDFGFIWDGGYGDDYSIRKF